MQNAAGRRYRDEATAVRATTQQRSTSTRRDGGKQDKLEMPATGGLLSPLPEEDQFHISSWTAALGKKTFRTAFVSLNSNERTALATACRAAQCRGPQLELEQLDHLRVVSEALAAAATHDGVGRCALN